VLNTPACIGALDITISKKMGKSMRLSYSWTSGFQIPRRCGRYFSFADLAKMRGTKNVRDTRKAGASEKTCAFSTAHRRALEHDCPFWKTCVCSSGPDTVFDSNRFLSTVFIVPMPAGRVAGRNVSLLFRDPASAIFSEPEMTGLAAAKLLGLWRRPRVHQYRCSERFWR